MTSDESLERRNINTVKFARFIFIKKKTSHSSLVEILDKLLWCFCVLFEA